MTPTYAGATAFAHEWGHAMHAVLARSAQPFETCNAPPFVREVASTCHEQLLVRHMLRTAHTREERLFYLGQQLDTFAFVFFRQALRAEFEARVHARVEGGEALSGGQLTVLYHELLTRYYGPAVVTDPAYAIEWARQAQYVRRVLRLPVRHRDHRRRPLRPVGPGRRRARARSVPGDAAGGRVGLRLRGPPGRRAGPGEPRTLPGPRRRVRVDAGPGGGGARLTPPRPAERRVAAQRRPAMRAPPNMICPIIGRARNPPGKIGSGALAAPRRARWSSVSVTASAPRLSSS